MSSWLLQGRINIIYHFYRHFFPPKFLYKFILLVWTITYLKRLAPWIVPIVLFNLGNLTLQHDSPELGFAQRKQSDTRVLKSFGVKYYLLPLITPNTELNGA